MTNRWRSLTALTLAAALLSVPLISAAAPPVVNAALPATAGSTLGRPFDASPRTAAQRATAEVAADFSSIFATQAPTVANSGWSACPTPITWSVDAHELTAAETAREVANLQWAFAQWSQVSGLTFAFGGDVHLAFRQTDFTLTPTDGTVAADRQIYLDFVDDSETTMLGGATAGMGSPSRVLVSTKEIQAGVAIFRTDHVRMAGAKDPRAVRSLYLHELGHVLGLAHAALSANVMYPVVTDHVQLGAGDVTGVRAMTKPCAAPAPAPVGAPEPTDPSTPTVEPAPPADASNSPVEPAPPAPVDPSSPTPPSAPEAPAI